MTPSAALPRLLLLLLCSSSLLSVTANAQSYVIDDLDRFEALFKAESGELTTEMLQKGYLDPGSPGIEIFTPNRIQNADNLAKYIAGHQEEYQKAIDVCLPAARSAGPEASEALEKVKEMLGREDSAPVYILFGAGNSGGTAGMEGLTIGLEVVCRFANTTEEAKATIKEYVAHEVVHVYQYRIWIETGRDLSGDFTLLEYALMEGVADFVANLATGVLPIPEQEREAYGLAHEAELWEEFKAEMNDSELGSWMYGPGKDGRPSDLGYWIGKRISAAYYEQAGDKQAALLTLVSVDNAKRILEESKYMSP